MLKRTSEIINEIALSAVYDDLQIIRMNAALAKLETSELLAIHGFLSKEGLQFIYSNIDKVDLKDASFREHITWSHYSKQIQEGIPSDEIFEELILEYKKNKYIALESIVVALLKEDELTEKQVQLAKSVMPSKIVLKEIYALNCRKKINNGIELSGGEISLLLENRSYVTIELAIRNKKVSEEGILLLQKPYEETRDKKIRRRLGKEGSLSVSHILNSSRSNQNEE